MSGLPENSEKLKVFENYIFELERIYRQDAYAQTYEKKILDDGFPAIFIRPIPGQAPDPAKINCHWVQYAEQGFGFFMGAVTLQASENCRKLLVEALKLFIDDIKTVNPASHELFNKKLEAFQAKAEGILKLDLVVQESLRKHSMFEFRQQSYLREYLEKARLSAPLALQPKLFVIYEENGDIKIHHPIVGEVSELGIHDFTNHSTIDAINKCFDEYKELEAKLAVEEILKYSVDQIDSRIKSLNYGTTEKREKAVEALKALKAFYDYYNFDLAADLIGVHAFFQSTKKASAKEAVENLKLEAWGVILNRYPQLVGSIESALAMDSGGIRKVFPRVLVLKNEDPLAKALVSKAANNHKDLKFDKTEQKRLDKIAVLKEVCRMGVCVVNPSRDTKLGKQLGFFRSAGRTNSLLCANALKELFSQKAGFSSPQKRVLAARPACLAFAKVVDASKSLSADQKEQYKEEFKQNLWKFGSTPE